MKVKELLFRPSKVHLRDRTYLLAHLLRVNHKELYLMEDLEVSPQVEEAYLKELKRVEEGYPLQYVLGEWDFYGHTFQVEEGVLIPRPETELLVEEALKRLPERRELLGLELGVGTGCISISLLLHRKNLRMVAGDISLKALRLAKRNAERHGVYDRLFLFCGDLFQPLKPKGFDFILSNPPYIPRRLWECLPEGLRIEGYNSLIAGMKGWEFYERISLELGNYLKRGGFFVFEIGHDQGKRVKGIFEGLGYSSEVLKDLQGQDRLVVGWRY
ncbi:MAG: peptide chain release factor N(5)-glutamine methyltransferase [Aquificaceae bacterium]